MSVNKNSTRYYSDKQEKSVCKLLNAIQVSNSGASKWHKGDCILDSASLCIECKTVTKEHDKITIKKEWLDKNKRETREMRLCNSALAINFGPDTNNYFVIDSDLMQFLVEKLKDENI